MKLKFIFSLIEYLGKSTEFFWDFSKFLYFPPLVDIYRHPLLKGVKKNAIYFKLFWYKVFVH